MAYSDAFKTEAMIRLAVNKYDYNKTADQVNVTARTLRNWEKSFPKKGVPDLLNRAIERMLSVIPETWSGQDWAIALGILIDKWLILQGEPTQRTENFINTFEALTEDEKQAVIQEAQDFIAGIGTSGVKFSDNGK